MGTLPQVVRCARSDRRGSPAIDSVFASSRVRKSWLPHSPIDGSECLKWRSTPKGRNGVVRAKLSDTVDVSVWLAPSAQPGPRPLPTRRDAYTGDQSSERFAATSEVIQSK